MRFLISPSRSLSLQPVDQIRDQTLHLREGTSPSPPPHFMTAEMREASGVSAAERCFFFATPIAPRKGLHRRLVI